MRVRDKTIYEAVQWHQNGDHPLDDVFRPFEDTGVVPINPREGAFVRRFNHPRVSGLNICGECKHAISEHGWIDSVYVGGDGIIVCPGDFVLTVPWFSLSAPAEDDDVIAIDEAGFKRIYEEVL